MRAAVEAPGIPVTCESGTGINIGPDLWYSYNGERSGNVVVNTCGFIDAAVAESLDAIGEALAENGKVIVTGCLGAKDGGGVTGQRQRLGGGVRAQLLALLGPRAEHPRCHGEPTWPGTCHVSAAGSMA